MKYKMKKIDAAIIIIMIAIAGFVLYKVEYIPSQEESDIPDIEFIKDEARRTLTIYHSSGRVLWEDLEIDGVCDKSELGRYITEGDQLTDCSGIIYIKYKSTNKLLFTFKFPPIAKLPISPISGNLRDISPEDEGAHFNTILNTREWWYFTVIFDKNSELAGWVATIGFCHLAWGDLSGTLRPDLLVVTLHSPDGKEYGGMINMKRGGLLGFGVIGSKTFEATSPGLDLKFKDSWAKGESPTWHVHAEDDNIDTDNTIIMDFDFFAPSPGYWTHSSRLIDMGEGSFANYIFIGCDVTGTVKLNNEEYSIKGIGHHEHCWSSGFLNIVIKGWDWSHMKLDNGWNIYYGKYYVTKQRIDSKTTKINAFSTLIVTTDQGEKLTILRDLDITTKESDSLFLLLKMPSKIRIYGRPHSILQPLLKTYNIYLDLEIDAENTYDKTWKFPTYVGMKVGLNTCKGKIKWSDDEGSHEIDLIGSGSIWNMRKF